MDFEPDQGGDALSECVAKDLCLPTPRISMPSDFDETFERTHEQLLMIAELRKKAASRVPTARRSVSSQVSPRPQRSAASHASAALERPQSARCRTPRSAEGLLPLPGFLELRELRRQRLREAPGPPEDASPRQLQSPRQPSPPHSSPPPPERLHTRHRKRGPVPPRRWAEGTWNHPVEEATLLSEESEAQIAAAPVHSAPEPTPASPSVPRSEGVAESKRDSLDQLVHTTMVASLSSSRIAQKAKHANQMQQGEAQAKNDLAVAEQVELIKRALLKANGINHLYLTTASRMLQAMDSELSMHKPAKVRSAAHLRRSLASLERKFLDEERDAHPREVHTLNAVELPRVRVQRSVNLAGGLRTPGSGRSAMTFARPPSIDGLGVSSANLDGSRRKMNSARNSPNHRINERGGFTGFDLNGSDRANPSRRGSVSVASHAASRRGSLASRRSSIRRIDREMSYIMPRRAPSELSDDHWEGSTPPRLGALMSARLAARAVEDGPSTAGVEFAGEELSKSAELSETVMSRSRPSALRHVSVAT
ncbi:hypothetical protein AB1Y20_003177 [Prymnesium parvum]|uniref:Uncharacterized protein n=1 Tax=Prymnesium parvum TaxID=97485 RepID=A0AB34JE32_PRYPA